MSKELILPDSGVIFTESSHEYHLDGKQLQGITGILRRQLFPKQYANVPQHILQNAAERGTAVHDAAEEYDLFGTYTRPERADSDPQTIEFIEAYVGLTEVWKMDVRYNEYLVTDNTHYASAIDKVFFIGDDLCLGDVKTTYKLDMDYVSWQLSIYKYLFEKQTGIKVDRLYAIWTREGGKLKEAIYMGDDKVKDLLDSDRANLQPDSTELTVSEEKEALVAIKALRDVMIEIDEAKAREKDLKAKVEAMFEEKGIDKWETEYFTFTKVKPTMKKVFDIDLFKEENPEVFEEYAKLTLDTKALKSKEKALYNKYVFEDGIARKGYIRQTKKW